MFRYASATRVILTKILTLSALEYFHQAIFSDSGSISSASEIPSRIKGAVTVQLRFNNAADAEKARKTFDGQVADGRKLEVVVTGSALLANALASGVTPIGKGFDLLPDTPATGGGM